LGGGEDGDTPHLGQCEQIPVAADDRVSTAGNGTGDHPVVIRVAANARDGLGQLDEAAQANPARE
jgi:hypothetical protein